MSTPQTLEVPGYQVMQFLGSGARSTIWQIKDHRSARVFALKRVVKRQSSDQRYLDQAANEYEIGVRFNHPVIRRIHSFKRIKRWMSLKEVHLVMEFCPGRTLQDHPPEDVREVVRVYSEVATALAYMNAHGFVHADIKPNNIIVAAGGAVKIIDLGQSCRLGTIKDRIQGTPDFIAPEQVHRHPLDGRTDVYNFGAAMYWTLTGRPIPTLMGTKGVISMMSDLVVVPPEQINPQVPTALSRLIIDCIEFQPPHRPQSMNEVVSRLSLISHVMDRDPNAPPDLEGV
ncbi:MAG TPA: hypothetical protein DCX07_13255 [Phycisphaerales bacterium]|nr:hypothetical protein [Phycisphaerales bacterium]